jgi:hypothetical protein
MGHFLVFWIVPINKSPTFYETQRFCTMFTKTHHQILFWVRWIQTISSLIFLFKIYFNTTVSFKSRVFRWSLPFHFSQKILYVFFITFMHTTYLPHLTVHKSESYKLFVYYFLEELYQIWLWIHIDLIKMFNIFVQLEVTNISNILFCRNFI